MMTTFKLAVREPNFEPLHRIENKDDLEIAKSVVREVAAFKSVYNRYEVILNYETIKLKFYFDQNCYIDSLDINLLYSLSHRKMGGWEIGFKDNSVSIEIMKNSVNRVIRIYEERTIEITDEHNVSYLHTSNKNYNEATERRYSEKVAVVKKYKSEKEPKTK